MQEEHLPKELYAFDHNNHRSFFQGYPEDLRTSYNRSFREITKNTDFREGKIIIAGSSWSMNAAKILLDYLDKTNIFFCEDYKESLKLDEKDKIIILSYSGNSEEAVTWLKHARRANAKTIIITSGGRLSEDSFDNPVIELTKGLPSKCSTFTILGALLKLLEDANIIPEQIKEVQSAVDFLRKNSVAKIASELSEKLLGVIPIIYGTTSLKNVSKKFKMLINSNAKTTAFHNELPGADYYEAEGFTNKNALFHAVILSSAEDVSRLKKKTTVFKENLKGQGVDVTEINIKGKGLTRIITGLMIAEVTSYYLALRYKQDPLNSRITDKIKKDMGLLI